MENKKMKYYYLLLWFTDVKNTAVSLSQADTYDSMIASLLASRATIRQLMKSLRLPRIPKWWNGMRVKDAALFYTPALNYEYMYDTSYSSWPHLTKKTVSAPTTADCHGHSFGIAWQVEN